MTDDEMVAEVTELEVGDEVYFTTTELHGVTFTVVGVNLSDDYDVVYLYDSSGDMPLHFFSQWDGGDFAYNPLTGVQFGCGANEMYFVGEKNVQ